MTRMRSKLLILALLCPLFAAPAHAAPHAPRPYAGVGVLALKQVAGAEALRLTLYQEPGLLRIAEFQACALPRLAGSREEPLLAAGARRGGWTRLAHDDAGRQGWLEQRRGWEYASWQEFLPGRTVRILPGMKKVLYQLKGDPREAAAAIAALNRDQQVRVLQVRDDWARLQTPSGWFRWRDGDGRLTVSLQGGGEAEKR